MKSQKQWSKFLHKRKEQAVDKFHSGDKRKPMKPKFGWVMTTDGKPVIGNRDEFIIVYLRRKYTPCNRAQAVEIRERPKSARLRVREMLEEKTR